MRLVHPAILVLLIAAALIAPAHAEERERQLGLQPAYAMAYRDAEARSGGGGLVHLSHALSDELTLQLLGGAAAHPGHGAQLASFSAAAAVVYVLDVVRVVPFFECSLGLLGTHVLDGGEPRIGLGFGVGFGADYLVSRRLAIGVATRWAAALTDLGGLPLHLTVGPRLVARFGP